VRQEKRNKGVFILFLCLVLFSSCAQEKSSDGNSGGGPFVFPHPVGWEKPDSHGVAALGDAKSGCKDCHGTDLLGGWSGVSCYECHANYPHVEGWVAPSAHGAAYLANKDSCKTQCHGADLTGGLSGVACNKCHSDYPHVDPNWTAPGNLSGHANTFIADINAGNINVCKECHGASYDVLLDGKSCLTCHPSGVTHTEVWSQGTQHGITYSSSYGAGTFADSNCSHCHGAPKDFEAADTKESLVAQSLCYRCHWVYPHISYVYGGTPQSWTTESFPGHRRYIAGSSSSTNPVITNNSPLFTDSEGNSPTSRLDLPRATNAVIYTCGRNTDGVCHNGNRLGPSRTPGNMCSSHCHK